MNNLVIYDGFDTNNNYIVVKTIKTFDDFKDGIRVFCAPPYNEILTDEDCKEEYDSYDKNGIVFGLYVNDKLAGLNCILNDVHDNYSIGFYDKDKVGYYSGLAIKEPYRRKGYGKRLVKETQDFLEKEGIYDYTYARILCEGSMSEGIFRLNGFVDAYADGKLIVDDVQYDRNDPNIPQSDKRKYMVKTINPYGTGWYHK